MTQQTLAGHIPTWTVGDRLRKAREDANLSQKQLADLTGISQRSISAYEGQAQAPKRPVLVSISLATGVPVDWLTDEKAPTPDGDGGTQLPRLDSNQQPSGYRFAQVRALRAA